MNRPTLFMTAQGWSRLLGALSSVPVIFWAVENWELSQQAEVHTQAGGFVCGIGAMVLLFACMMCAGTLSLSAIALGAFSYSRVPKPRPTSRMIELAAVGHFFVLGLIGYAFLLAGKAFG